MKNEKWKMKNEKWKMKELVCIDYCKKTIDDKKTNTNIIHY